VINEEAKLLVASPEKFKSWFNVAVKVISERGDEGQGDGGRGGALMPSEL
jgi:hypothetical protein